MPCPHVVMLQIRLGSLGLTLGLTPVGLLEDDLVLLLGLEERILKSVGV